MFKTKIFETVTGLIIIRYHLRGPGAEVLDTADLDGWIMDVDPVIVEGVAILQNEHDGEKVAVVERLGCTLSSFGGGRPQPTAELPHWCGRNHMLGFKRLDITLSIFK